MSKIQVDSIVNNDDTGAPDCPRGLTVTGVVTATSYIGDGSTLTGIGQTVDVRTNSLVVSGITTVAAGSTSAPSITPTGDSNTGIFFPSADTIAFGEGGVEAARIDSSGRFGIGTASVTGKLSIDGSGLDPIPSLNTASNYAVALYGGSTTGSGNGIAFCNDNGTAVGGAIIHIDQGSNNLGDLAFYTAATSNSPTERMRIDSNGRLLVGTSSNTTVAGKNSTIQVTRSSSTSLNASILIREVEQSTSYPALFINKNRQNNAMQSDNRLGAVEFAGDTGSSDAVAARISADADAWSGSSYPTSLKFFTTASGSTSPTERMRITSAGYMGLGTNNPSAILDISGNNPAIEVDHTGTNSQRAFVQNNDGTLRIRQDPDNSGSSSAITFEVDASEKARILAGGGITFNGDTAAANALDDYEEGTWTPVIADADTGGNTVTHVVQNGLYTKVGNIVTAYFRATWSSLGSCASGSLIRIRGLPYSAKSNTDQYYYTGTLVPIDGPTTVLITGNQTHGIFYDDNSPDIAQTFAALPSSNTGNGLNGTITYLAN